MHGLARLQFVENDGSEVGCVNAEEVDQVGRFAFFFSQNAEEDVLDTEVAVLHSACLGLGALQSGTG